MLASRRYTEALPRPAHIKVRSAFIERFRKKNFDDGLREGIAALDAELASARSEGELPLAEKPASTPEKPILVLDTGGHTAKVNKVLFTPDGMELISVSDDKTIRIWDVGSGAPLRVLRPPIGPGIEGMLFAAAVTPDGQTLAVGGLSFSDEKLGEIHLIDLKAGRIAGVLKGHESWINALSFSPSGERLASGSADRTVRVWGVSDGRCERVFKGHKGQVLGVAFTPDGRRIATASMDETARIWSLDDGQSIAVLRGHQKEVRCVAWRPDGKVLATGGDDGNIRQWDPDGSAFQGFGNLGDTITSLAFTTDSREPLFHARRPGRRLVARFIHRSGRIEFRPPNRFPAHCCSIAQRHADRHGRCKRRGLSMAYDRRHVRPSPGGSGPVRLGRRLGF